MDNKCLKILNLIKYINILVFILFSVFLNTSIHIFLYLIYLFISFITSYLYYKKGLIKYSKTEAIVFILVTLLIIVSLVFGNHGIYNTVASFAFLFVSYFDFSNQYKDIEEDKRVISILDTTFYYTIIFLLLFDLGYHLLFSPDFENYSLLNIGDKNYSAVIIFLFFIYSFKNKYYLGIFLSLVFFLLFKSRLIFLSVIIFLLLEFYFKVVKHKNKKIIDFIKLNKTMLIYLSFAFSIIAVVILSVFWSLLPQSSVKEYKKSFNDGSNAMRVRSNLYAIKEVNENYELIFSGYDKDILSVLNLDNNPDGNEFMGYRLVQPHHFFLNIVLRFGLILSIFYILILTKIISENINKNNISIFLSYLFMNMFMHSLIVYPILILFLYVFTTKYPKSNIVKDHLLEGSK